MTGFGDRLLEALTHRVPLCVGIDPHPQLLVDWGLRDDVAGLRTFATEAAHALAGEVAAIKPQSAFFERHGSRGIAVLEETIAICRAAGALVVLDAKRGDIGSTAAAYADAYLNPTSALFADALTVSPYVGFGSLEPFVSAARNAHSGLFVLARTSNPDGEQVQSARVASEKTVSQLMIESATALNVAECDAGAQIGSIGVVVGATVTPGTVDLSNFSGPVLMPGLGAQGASAADISAVAQGASCVLPSTSRDVLRAGPDRLSLAARARSVGSAFA